MLMVKIQRMLALLLTVTVEIILFCDMEIFLFSLFSKENEKIKNSNTDARNESHQ